MRGLRATAVVIGLALAPAAPAARAQDSTATPPTPQAPVPPARPGLRADSGLTRLLDDVRRDPEGSPMPSAEAIGIGGRTVAPGESVAGPVAAVRGTLDVYGTVNGNAVAVDGDVVVHAGGRVRGDALAVRGEVRIDGGTVDGEIRTLSGAVGPAPVVVAKTRSPLSATWRALQIALGSMAVLAVVGIAVLVLASGHLDTVTEVIEVQFARSFWTGLVGQVALLPALLLLIVALAISIIGLLVIPFAVVAFVLAAAGLATLGFLAVARVTGGIVLRTPERPISERGAALRALMGGVGVYAGLWLLAAAFTWNGPAGATLRAIAFALTWVATTTGFGAALLSRAGTRQLPTPSGARPQAESVEWETPTPIGGVVAARRPTPAGSPTEPRPR